VLDSGMQSDRVEQDDRWSQTLKHEVGDAPVEVRALLGQTTMTVADLMNMKAGDVLSTDFTGTLTLLAEDIPMFRGAYGMSRGQQAVRVGDLIRRPRPAGVDDLVSRRPAASTSANSAATSLVKTSVGAR
jgi:flagellar motor switch protein FliM